MYNDSEYVHYKDIFMYTLPLYSNTSELSEDLRKIMQTLNTDRYYVSVNVIKIFTTHEEDCKIWDVKKPFQKLYVYFLTYYKYIDIYIYMTQNVNSWIKKQNR